MKRILARVLLLTLILSLTLLALGAASTGRGCNCGMLSSFFQSCNPEEEKPYEQEEDYIYFGVFPQTIKANNVEITETQDERGYYLGSDGFYYAKVDAMPYLSGYTFSNGESVRAGEIFYFKVEPIKWKIIQQDDEQALILCENIIINKPYDSGNDNNYEYSGIRGWLNGEFYQRAFDYSEQDIIITTDVDNSAQTTYSTDYNENACDDTYDKVFLMSYQDMLSADFGYNSEYAQTDSTREKSVTDYARATGAKIDTSSDFYGNGFWWLRSPTSYYTTNAASVESNGVVIGNYYYNTYYYVNITHYGVVPAINIKL